MRRAPSLILALLLSAVPAARAQDDASIPLFQTQTGLVMVSFHVTGGKNYVNNLKASDVVLLEDGKPREFSIFDAPSAASRIPLELVLLFDTNPAAQPLWDPAGVFLFSPKWNDAMSQALLEAEGAVVRFSVYRCAGQALLRMNSATTDPPTLTDSLRRVLSAPRNTDERFKLTLPPQRDRVGAGPYTDDYVTSPFVLAGQRGWPMEAAIGVLNQVAAAGDKVSRVFVMFSEGIGATTTIPEDVGNQALDLGIPIYPVATNYRGNITGMYPRNLFRMQQFKALGKMTGGRASEYSAIDAARLSQILTSVITDALAEYVVGFVPSSGSTAARPHTIEVKLGSKSLGTLAGGKRRAVY